MVAFTTRRLLPARSPTLPAVEVTFTDVDVKVDAKFAPTIEFCACNEIEFGAVRAAPNASPPVVAVMSMFDAVIVPVAPELTPPADNKLNVLPAVDAPPMLLVPAVF